MAGLTSKWMNLEAIFTETCERAKIYDLSFSFE